MAFSALAHRVLSVRAGGRSMHSIRRRTADTAWSHSTTTPSVSRIGTGSPWHDELLLYGTQYPKAKDCPSNPGNFSVSLNSPHYPRVRASGGGKVTILPPPATLH